MKTPILLMIAGIMLFSTCNGRSFLPNEKEFRVSDKDYSFSREFKATTPLNLKISTAGGNITATGREDNTVEIAFIVKRRGQLLDITLDELKQLADVEITNDDSNISIEIKRIIEKNVSVGFDIKTPVKTSANLMTSGGNISITGIAGIHKIGTSGGNINCDQISGNVEANTSGGNVSINNSEAQYNAFTSGGNISMNNINGRLRVSTSGGNIDADNINQGLTAHTSGGNISLMNVQGPVDVNTSGGSIHLDGISGSVSAITSGGDISANIVKLIERLELETSGGNINTSIPDGLGLDLDVSADQINVPLSNFTGSAKKNRINGQMNGGGIAVHLSTSGGVITMKFK